MALKPATWFPVALALSAMNLISIPFYVSEPAHAAAHLMLATVCGVWASRLRRSMAGKENRLESAEAIDALYGEVNDLRNELSELQERLDFTERLLAQQADARYAPQEQQHSP